MFWFPIVAVTNYYKPSGFKQHKHIILQFYRSNAGLTGYNQGVSKAVLLLKALGENTFPCFLHFPQPTHIPWLPAPFSIFKASSGYTILPTPSL